MLENKQIPEFKSYEEMGEFWDEHSLDDYWDQTQPAEFEISKPIQNRFLTSIDPILMDRLQNIARDREISIESLVNLLLEQRLQELSK